LAISNAWLFKNVAAEPQVQVLGGRPAPAQILNTFRLEQRGEAVQVIDQDGSVYTGFAQPVEPTRVSGEPVIPSVKVTSGVVTGRGQVFAYGGAVGSTGAGETKPSVEAARIEAQKYFFRVAGVNRSLNQQIVFSGQLVQITNVAVPGAPAVSGVVIPGKLETAGRAVTTQVPDAQIHSFRVMGAAVVGETQAVSIDAISLP